MPLFLKCGVVVGGWLTANAAPVDQDGLILLQTHSSSKRSRVLDANDTHVSEMVLGSAKGFSNTSSNQSQNHSLQGNGSSSTNQSGSTNQSQNHSIQGNHSGSANQTGNNTGNHSTSPSANITTAQKANQTTNQSSTQLINGSSHQLANVSGNHSVNSSNQSSLKANATLASSASVGMTASLDELGYTKVVGLKSSVEMEKFILRTASSLDITVSNTGHRALQGFVPFYSGEKAKSSFLRLTNEMKRIAKLPRAWLSPKGSTAPLNEVGFAAVAALHDTHEMAKFTRRVANEMMNLEVVHEEGLVGFAPFYSGEKARKGYDVLQIELQVAAKAKNSWLLPRTAPLQHAGQDCWDSCNQTGGFCAHCGAGNACCRKGFAQNPSECKAAMNYLTIKHECVAIATGAFAPLNEVGYVAVAALQNETQMERYIRRAAAALDMTVKSDQSLRGLVPFYSGTKSKRSFAALQAEMKKIASRPNAWLAPRGETAQLTEEGYSTVAALGSSLEMAQFVRRTINSMHMQVKNEQGLRGLVPYYSGERTRGNFSALQSELRRVAAKPNSWLHQP